MNEQPPIRGTETEHLCPLCRQKLRSTPGSVLRAEGVTLHCPNLGCPAQEVTGYGTTANAAFKIITEKYKPFKP